MAFCPRDRTFSLFANGFTTLRKVIFTFRGATCDQVLFPTAWTGNGSPVRFFVGCRVGPNAAGLEARGKDSKVSEPGALSHPFLVWLGGFNPTKIEYRKRQYPYSSLSTGGPSAWTGNGSPVFFRGVPTGPDWALGVSVFGESEKHFIWRQRLFSPGLGKKWAVRRGSGAGPNPNPCSEALEG